MTCNKQENLLYIVYILPTDCLLIPLYAHMLSFWALGPGPGPISIMAEHRSIKGNQ